MEKREFKKKEFLVWFKQLEVVAKDEYLLVRLNKKKFEESYKEGFTINQAIEKFLNE